MLEFLLLLVTFCFTSILRDKYSKFLLKRSLFTMDSKNFWKLFQIIYIYIYIL